MDRSCSLSDDTINSGLVGKPISNTPSLVHTSHPSLSIGSIWNIISGTPSICTILIISFSSVHQSHAHYLWYTYSILIISFSSVHQSHAHYLWYTIPFKLPYYLLFINLMPIISGTPIPFLSHSPLFVNLMSIISGRAIPFKLSHSLLFINLMHIISGTPFHSNYLIIFCSSISCPLSLVHLFHSYNLILFCSSISCTLSLVHHSIQITLLSSVHQSHAHYLWYTYSILISLSSVHQFHVHYIWYSYSIQIISFSFVHQSHAHYLWYTIPFKLPYYLLFINLMSIISGTPIPFLSLSPLFVNLISIISGRAIPFKLSHSLLFINLMHIISGTPFHSNYLIIFCSSISCPLSLVHLFHSYNLILFCSSISCPLSLVHHSIQITLLSSVHQSHAHYLWYTYSILISLSSVHQSHVHYIWYSYSIQIISFSFVHQSHAHYLRHT